MANPQGLYPDAWNKNSEGGVHLFYELTKRNHDMDTDFGLCMSDITDYRNKKICYT